MNLLYGTVGRSGTRLRVYCALFFTLYFIFYGRFLTHIIASIFYVHSCVVLFIFSCEVYYCVLNILNDKTWLQSLPLLEYFMLNGGRSGMVFDYMHISIFI